MTELTRAQAIIAVHDEDNIKGFFGDYKFLSNFYPCKVVYDGDRYPSSEHAYQAAKFPKEDRTRFFTCTAAEAKDFGKKANMIPLAWDSVKYTVMEGIVQDKFTRNRDLADMLVQTGDKYLEETNYWGDTYWGKCKGKGANMLGLILMGVRDKMKKV